MPSKTKYSKIGLQPPFVTKQSQQSITLNLKIHTSNGKKTTTNKQNKLQNETIKITIMIVIIVFWNAFGPVQNIIKS